MQVITLGRLFHEENADDKVNCDDFVVILREWISGESFINISNTVGIDIADIEKVCRNQLAYGLSLYVGHLIDLTANENEIEKLQLLQKRVKYGLPDKLSIDSYESGLADRFVCQKINDDIFLHQKGMDTETFLKQFSDWINRRYCSLKVK